MDQQIGIREIVESKIQEYKIGEFSTRPNIMDQLIQIETYFQGFISKQNDIVKEVKKWSKINLLLISKGANVTRATIYNNPNTLKAYIDNRVAEIEKEDLLGVKRNNKLKSEYEELKEVTEGLKTNIVENYIHELKIEELEAEIKNVTSINESLSKQIQQLKRENNELRKKTTINNVIPISK